MAAISMSTIDSTDEKKKHLFGNGTETRSNTNMDSTPIKALEKGKFDLAINYL